MGNLHRLVSAAAGLVLMTGIAHAGLQVNGVQTNGVLWANGVQTNGVQTNGVQTNGVQTNGVQTNGVQTNGVQTNGIVLANQSVVGTQVQGSFIGSGSSTIAYTCAHREDVSGGALPSGCSPCAQTVAAVDSYCSSTAWDQQCVQEAVAMCRATLTTGSILTANLADGSTRSMRVGTRYQGGVTTDPNSIKAIDNTDVWTQNVTWILPHAPNTVGERLAAGQVGNACVRTVCAADNYCCNNSWDQQCVNEAASMCTFKLANARTSTNGDSVCGYEPNTGSARQAMFVGGTWNMSSGYQGAGGKNAATNGAFTLACRGVGAVAKCVDMGYKPWLNPTHDVYHQACVRMVRADYCGDGTSWTTDGTPINVTDYFAIQEDTTAWWMEATWNQHGARYLWASRLQYGNPVTAGFGAYVTAHPYCTYNPATGRGFENTGPYNSNWYAAHTLNSSVTFLKSESDRSCDGPDCPP